MTTVEHTAFASPLSLLEQWRNDLPEGPPLREFVVLGYTLDLAFLERFCIPPARQLGARITVLADASQGLHDAVDVRFAGHSYQHGVATLPGAFHPKLAVLLGDKHVWFAIGSGNPTMAGWGHNHELWCVLRGHTSAGPQVQADLGRWMSRLAERVPLPSWIGATIAEVGSRIIPNLVDDTHPDIRLLQNLDEPLLGQLGEIPAAELRLAAPFFDPSGRAVRALLDASRPQRLRIALQTELSSFDGRSLVDAASRIPDNEFCLVDDRRTLHGKLVEWCTPEGHSSALVGSANITSAALLRSVPDGGNCELAIVAPVAESLFPQATAMASSQIATVVAPAQPVQRGPALHLLGVCKDAGGLALEFVCRFAADVMIETSPDGSPGSWETKRKVPAAQVSVAGVTSAKIEAPEVVSGAARVVAVIDGTRIESAPLFITDLARCRPQTDVSDAPRLRQDYGIDDLIKDEALAARFSRDLLRLIELSAAQRASRIKAPSIGAADRSEPAEIDRWQQFMDVVTHSLGLSVTELIFPGALPSPMAAEATTWSVAQIVDETELAEGETEAAIEEIDEDTVRQARRIPPGAHQRYRGRMRQLVTAIARPRVSTPTTNSAQPALPLRMAVGAVFLDLLAAGVWQSEEGWRSELADLVEAIVADPDEITETPAEGRGYLGSLVAVCLAVLTQDVSLHGGSPADIVARRAWEAAHPVAAEAETSIIESLLLKSSQRDARFASATDVSKVVKLAREALEDPHAEALAGLAADGYEVAQISGVWVARGPFNNTMRVAARMVTEMSGPDGVIALAVGSSRATMMTYHGSTLMMADAKVRQWRTYSVRPPSTPASLFRGDEGVPSTRITAPLYPVPEPVRELSSGLNAELGELLRDYLASGPPAPPRRDRTWDW